MRRSSFAQIDAVERWRVASSNLAPPSGTWRGSRPTLPDSLDDRAGTPAFEFSGLRSGNQHIGFTTGPATGAAIAAMIGGTPPSFDVTAFAPSRLPLM